MAGPSTKSESPVPGGIRHSSPLITSSETSSDTGRSSTAPTSVWSQDIVGEKHAKTVTTCAAKDYKPDTKVPIVRLPYEISALPILYVREVDIVAKAADDEPKREQGSGQGAAASMHHTRGRLVVSQRLVQEALRELIPSLVHPRFIGRVAVNTHARKGILPGSGTVTKGGPTTHLIIPLGETENPDSIWVQGKGLGSSVFSLSKTMMKQRRQGGVQGEASIVCEVGPRKPLKPERDGHDGRLYKKCYETIFRTYANLDGRKDFRAGPMDIFLPTASYGSKPPGLSNIDLRIRCRPMLEIDGRDHAKIHLDYDLAPVMSEGTRLTAVLDNYFLATGLRDAPSKNGIIRHLLCGLHVTYKSGAHHEKRSVGQLDGGSVHTGKGFDSSPPPKNSTPASTDGSATTGSFPRARVIRDVRPADQMRSTFVETNQGTKSVMELLGSMSTSSVTFQKYPIANIGGKHPFWVTLHDLYIERDQVYRNAGHFTRDLKAALRNFQDHGRLMSDIEAHGLRYIKEALASPQLPQHKSGFGIGVRQTNGKSYVLPKQSTSFNCLVRPHEHRDEANSPLALQNERLTIVYLCPDDDGFEAKLKERLESPAQSMFRFANVRTVRLESLGELIRQQVDMNSPLMKAVFHPESSVIIGVLNSSSISGEKYKEVRAELQRFGDRKPGAVTVCADKQDLQSQLERPGTNVFAANLFRKIKLMLGHQVWNTDDIDYEGTGFDPKCSIVVGAHISHPAQGATNLCPSVASVVSSVDGNLMLFPGSTRLVPAKDKQTSGSSQCQIEDLKGMMKERFAAWQAQSSRHASRPLNVLFYRSAYDPSNVEACGKEIDAIKAAYQEVFSSPLEGENGLAYIVMHRNARSHSSFTFTTAESGYENSAKYQYFVHPNTNTTGLTPEQLARVTATLNVTAQLGNISSKALPLAYAQKLSRRVLDYFRWFSHKDITNFPPIARQAPYDAENKAKEFQRYVEEYLSTTPKLGQPGSEWDYVKFRMDDKPLPWNSKLDEKMFYL